MRKITIVSTKIDGKVELNSSATTWGELKPELTNNNISISDMKVMEKDSKMTLDSDSAVLPTGDVILFLTPGKVKSGNDEINAHQDAMVAKLLAVRDSI